MRDETPYTRRINRVLDHIGEHLDGDLSLDTLAGVACFSRFHFHRIFKAAVGETLHGFVQRQRLERAAMRMRSSPEASLTETALRVGFNGLAEFSRAFKAHFGIAPSAWDRRSPIRATGHREGPEALPRHDDEDLERFGRDGTVQVRRSRLPAARMAYLRVHDPYGNRRLEQAYHDLQRWLGESNVGYGEVVIAGMSPDDPEVTPLDKCRYDIGAIFPLDLGDTGLLGEILDTRGVAGGRRARILESVRSWPAAGARRPDGIGLRDFPPSELGCVRCAGTLAGVDLAWQYLYRLWLPQSRHQPADVPAMELFRKLPEEIGWERFDLEAAVALEPLAP